MGASLQLGVEARVGARLRLGWHRETTSHQQENTYSCHQCKRTANTHPAFATVSVGYVYNLDVSQGANQQACRYSMIFFKF